jgi:aminopeptidase YwaD
MFAPILLSTFISAPPEASKHLVPDATFQAIAGELSGELAMETMRRIVDQHRIQGSTMMAKSAEVVLGELKAAGLEAQIETFRSDGATRYGTFVSPLAWEIRRGELWVLGDEPFRLSRYADVPMSVSTYSKGGEWTGELIDAGKGIDDADYANKEVRGKVVLASGYAANVHRAAVIKRGAVGVVIYPNASDRPDHPDMIRYNGLWTHAAELDRASGGFQISANQYAKLRGLMAKGPVKVRGTIEATLGPGKMTLVHAWMRGTTQPEKEIMLIAHLDHPKWSANDNASGAAALVEIARTLTTLVRKNSIPKLSSTIHFVWVPEFFGTLAWASAHPEARRCGAWDDPRPKPAKKIAPGACIVAALNLDMVGEDTAKTNSRFYFTRTPDSVPSFLDALLADVLAQTRAAELTAPTGSRHIWPAEIIDYTQGSDHDILLGLGVPATMFGHWPDWTHHTSEDRLDKADASELLRVSVLAAAAASWMASADERQWERLELLRRADELTKWSGRIAGSSPARTKRVIARIARLSAELASTGGVETPAPKTGKGPRRLVLLPYDDLFEGLGPEDKKFVEEAQQKWDLELVIFEAVNLMDGRTTTAELAERLTDELGVELDAAWVDRLVQFLAAKKLVQP